jgi:DNA-binding LacI/PurR family transcriptional regulator
MPRRRAVPAKPKTVSLKVLAEYLQLSPATISVVLNGSPTANDIPEKTQQRIFAAAQKFNYRPNYIARSLRNKRSFTVAILAPELSEGYGALLLNAMDEALLQEGYFYFVATHRRRPDLLQEYPRMLMERSVEGFLVIDTALPEPLPLPTVTVSGHMKLPGITNVILDHRKAADLGLRHLLELGHERIAFMRGQSFSSDSEDRWTAIRQVAAKLGIKIQPELTIQLSMNTFSPMMGYPVMQELLTRTKDFTAVFAYNDFSAIGAIRALREAGLRVPEDVSVVGFDDINSAAFQNPGLTTIRQPLEKIGSIAAKALLQRLEGASVAGEILVQPELIVRESTCPARPRRSRRNESPTTRSALLKS